MVIGCGSNAREQSDVSIVMKIERSKDVLPKDIREEQNQNFSEKENEIALSHIDEQSKDHIHVEKEIFSRPSEKLASAINKGSLTVEDGKHRGELHLLKTMGTEKPRPKGDFKI